MDTARLTQSEINRSVLSVDHLKDELGGRTTRGGAIVMAAQIIRMAVQLVTTFFLARLLIPADFGIVAIGYTVLAMLSLFTDLGLSTVTVQTRDLDQDTTSALLILNVALSAVAVALSALASPLLVLAFHDNRIPWVVIGLTSSALVISLGSQHYALLMRNMKWKQLQIISLGSMVVGSVVAVLCAWLAGLGFWSLVVQAFVTAALGAIAAWIYCPWRPSMVRQWAGVWKALRTSLNISGTMMLNFCHRQLDNILIGWRWGPTELGFYSRSYSLLMMPLTLVTGPLASAIIPALSRLQDDPDRWRKAYLDALIVVTALGGGLAAILFGAATPIVEIILGPGWSKSALIFTYLSLAMLAATPMSTVVWIYVSLGRTARMFQWGLIGTSAYVGSFLIGLPYGGPGVALAYGIAQLLAFLPCLWMATRQSPVTLVDVLKACLPITATTIVVGAALRYLTSQFGLVLDVVISGLAGLTYVALIALIGWHWAPHRRVRDRAMAIAQSTLARLNGGFEKASDAGGMP